MTDAERVAEYQAGLAEWRIESAESLMAWAAMCGTDPETMRNNPHLGLEPAQTALGHEDLGALGDDDRNFVFSQLLALVAGVLLQRHGGDWAVDDDPASPTYARYVIDVDGTYYDPGQAVVDFMDAPPGRDLAACIAGAEAAATGS